MAANSRTTVPRLVVYGVATTVLTVGVVASAFTLHDYFYTGCVLLSQSGTAMMILANMGLLLTILLGKLLVLIFFGQLRVIEVERLYEQGWLSVTETCLALAILRDEFDAATLTMFVFLLFCKLFHWMLADRVAFMEQQTHLTALFLARITVLSILLFSVDCIMLSYAVGNTTRYGPTMMIVFGFEYALLLARFMATAAKFVLNSIDLARGGEWEDKQPLMFYVELVYDLARLVVNLFFFIAVMTYYGPPIHIMRDLYITSRSFYNRCRDWARYRKAMQNMNMRYQTVSQDELEAMSDTTCIICRDEMTGPSQEQADIWNSERRAGLAQNLSGDTPKRLPCSHVFHFNCLRNWLERQQSCPTCRHSVLEDPTPAVNDNDNRDPLPAPNDPPLPLDRTHADIAAVDVSADAARHQPEDLPPQSQNYALPDGVLSSPLENTAIPSLITPLSGTFPYNTATRHQPVSLQLPLASAGTTTMPNTASLISIFPPTGAPNSLSMHSLRDFPAPDLTTLSEEQIKTLESGSRAALEERIRILSAFQVQISNMVVALTQVQSLASQLEPPSTAPSSEFNSTSDTLQQKQELPTTKGKEPDI
ncbi:E3 ubiquitin-protein ligase hrd1 [Coemansia aciculifera]|uniref:E3 ubiquitin-protein ligase hrd1 n=1 Tax=Coemansia aciculifera TaxID=417176 RepID=A0ACC1M9E2_9FUNG|nr:E3 ubiquitin-protein ligase hrd1 [Coemansia aciculifera]KAJ2910083.1 E3 ubiquitin-protein ligase hrd1 [Coemansia aciculifera]